MEAIVLAGGLGTRLREVVKDLPKPMARVKDKPFLEYILNYLNKNGITRVILSVGYKWDTIKEYFGNKFKKIEIIYSIENEPLGTGGALKKALSLCKQDNVYIINGDTFFNINLKDLELRNNSKILLCLKYMKNFNRYGCVEIDDNGFVTTFTEKEDKDFGNINGGIYLISKNIFNEYNLEEKFSFEDFIKSNFRELKVFAQIFDGYFIDIGIPEDYQRSIFEIPLLI